MKLSIILFYVILGNIGRQCSAHGVAHRKYETSPNNKIVPRKLEYNFRETNSTQIPATNIPETSSMPKAASEGFTISLKNNTERVQTIPTTTSEGPTIATQTNIEGNQTILVTGNQTILVTVLEGSTIVKEIKVTQSDEKKSLSEIIKASRTAKKNAATKVHTKTDKNSKNPKKSKGTKSPKKTKKIKDSVKGESALGNIVIGKKKNSSNSKIPKTENSKEPNKSKKTLGKIQSKSKAAKSKSKKSDYWCPFRSNSSERMLDITFKKKSKLTFKSKSSKGTSKKGLIDSFGQKPGSAITITSVTDPTSCIKPVEVSDGAHLTLQPCTYDYPNDTFVIDRFGRLHTSDWSLCVISIDSALVLGSCDSCSAVFGYDEETMMMFLYEEETKVVTMEDSNIFLTDIYDDENTSRELQTWYFMVIGSPTSSPAPTAAPFPN